MPFYISFYPHSNHRIPVAHQGFFGPRTTLQHFDHFRCSVPGTWTPQRREIRAWLQPPRPVLARTEASRKPIPPSESVLDAWLQKYDDKTPPKKKMDKTSFPKSRHSWRQMIIQSGVDLEHLTTHWSQSVYLMDCWIPCRSSSHGIPLVPMGLLP